MTSKAERRESKLLFADALLEAFERKYDEALADAADIELPDTSPISFERIYARISSQRRRKTAMLVAAILAALMLCGCTAYVYREKLANFLLEHTSISINLIPDDNVSMLSDPAPCYGLSYVPDGYELTDRFIAYGNVSYKWQNADKDTLTFGQYITATCISFNNKGGEPCEINHNGKTILYIKANHDHHSYLWKNGNYNLTISSTNPLSEEELIRMIDGLIITE